MKKTRFRHSGLFTALTAVTIAAGAFTVPVLAQEPSGTALLEYERNTVDVVSTYGPSVVAIDVTIAGRPVTQETLPPNMMPEFLRDFMPGFNFQFQQPQQQRARQTAGSGFVINPEGHILTNWHVVEGALDQEAQLTEGSRITVTFPGSDALPVRVLGASSLYDLALLELEDPDALPEGINPIELGDTSQLQPGQKAIAIGNPYGFESTVSQGIVSAVGRHFPYIGEVEFELVQTDAAINPGSSGGPLLDSSGRLIGVNTAIIPNVSVTGERGNLGIGFAVPSDIVRSVLPEMQSGNVMTIDNRPRLGITIRDLSAYPDELLQRLGLPAEGVGILQVELGSAAEEAGLRGSSLTVVLPDSNQQVQIPGDVITHVDGEPVNSSSTLQAKVFGLPHGTSVTLTVVRDGETMEVELTPRTEQEPSS